MQRTVTELSPSPAAASATPAWASWLLSLTPEQLDGAIGLLEQHRAKLNKMVALRREVARMEAAVGGRSTAGQVREIIVEVAEFYGVEVAELKGKGRPDRLAVPRHVACYLARQLTGAPLREVGELIGGRDHGTVLYGCRHVKGKAEAEPKFRAALARLRERCRRVLGEAQQRLEQEELL